jgi:hypothetical protein
MAMHLLPGDCTNIEQPTERARYKQTQDGLTRRVTKGFPGDGQEFGMLTLLRSQCPASIGRCGFAAS